MAKFRNKELRFRLWIDIDGQRFFGPGRAELLQLIDDTGSISKAAKGMGMSYKKAWAMVDELNDKAFTPYVITQKGGKKGGGAELTKAGKDIVKTYRKVLAKVSSVLDKHKSLLDLV
ncbi:MAG TPA: ModE family transcriptional regulator [Chryseosolibacter sp.]